MNILIPVLSLGKSGGIKVLSNLANYWTDMGNDVTIVISDQLNEPYYPVRCNIVYINSKGEKIEKDSGIKTSSIAQLCAIYKFLKKHSNNYDAVIANYNLTAYPIVLGSSAENFYYIQAYEPEFYNEFSGFRRYMNTFIAWYSYFLPFTRIVNSNLYTNYKNIVSDHVVYPGLDLNTYYPKIRERKDKDEKFIIGCIGRDILWKGSEDVSEAVKLLHKEGYDNIELVVAFHPVSYDKHKLVQPDGDINLSDFYRSLDILITPGHIQLDAVHYPVIEAMATCTPLITTGYYPSNEDNSLIVRVKDPADIANKIKQVMNNYDVAIEKSKLGLKDIEQFSWNNIASKFLKILSKSTDN